MSYDFVFFNELFQMFQFFEITGKDLMASQIRMEITRVETALISLEVVLDYFSWIFFQVDDSIHKGIRIEIDTAFAQIFVWFFFED